MKKLVTHVLSVCLLITSLPFLPSNLYAAGCSNELQQEARKKCDGTDDDNKALFWDEDTCRCVESGDSIGYNEQFNACAEDKDLDETGKMKCYMSNGLGAAGLSSCGGYFESYDDMEPSDSPSEETSNEDTANNCMNSLGMSSAAENWTNRVSMANMLLTIISWFGYSKKEKSSGMCAPTILMTAASLLGVANEVISFFFYESDLRDLQLEFYEEVLCDTSLSENSDSYSSKTSSENESDVSGGCRGKSEFDAQEDAFKYLHRERVITSEMYLKKAISYIVVGLAYTAAFTVGLLQLTGVITADLSCYGLGKNDQGEKIENKNSSLTKLIADTLTSFFLKGIIPKSHATSYQNNLTSGNLNTVEQFFKHNAYQCKLVENYNDCGYFETCQDTTEGYKTCMNCMRGASNNKELNSENDESFNSSVCDDTFEKDIAGRKKGWYKYKLHESSKPWVWQLIVGGVTAAGAIWISAATKLNGFGGVLIGQITLSLIGAITSFVAVAESFAHSWQAEDNAQDIEEVQEAFIDAITLHCPGGREDPNVRECYCFNPDGRRRTDRENAEGCQDLFNQLDNKFELKIGDLILGQETKKLSCVTLDGQPDPGCECKKFEDAKTGKNACFQVPLSSGEIGNILTGTGADQIIKDANILTGSDSSGNLTNTGRLLNSANNLSKVAKQLLKNKNNKLIKSGKQPIGLPQKQIAALNKSLVTPALIKAARTRPLDSSFAKKREKILSKAKKKIAKKKATFSGGSGLTFNKAKGNKKGMNFNFDQNNSGNKTKNFMDKKYKYNKNDVVKNNNASIWKVITNRYNNSGYTRLFEED